MNVELWSQSDNFSTLTAPALRAALEIRSERPTTALLVLSQHAQRRYATELLGNRAAGVGYLLTQRIGEVDRFVADVRRVCAGGTALDLRPTDEDHRRVLAVIRSLSR